MHPRLVGLLVCRDQRTQIRANEARPWHRAFKEAASTLLILFTLLLNSWLFLDEIAGWILVVWIVTTVVLALLNLWWVTRRLERIAELLSEWDDRVARGQELADHGEAGNGPSLKL